MDTDDTPARPARRRFFKHVGAILFGALAVLIPAAAGLTAFLAPLRRKAQRAGFVQLTTLNALPADGRPVRLSVIASRDDAWTRSPAVPIGAVYARRTGPESVEVFNTACTHAGCFVEYRPDLNGYFCPCHNSDFTLDGKIKTPRSPAPRDLDRLEVELRDGGQVWIKFQNFRAGEAQKIPV
jgi:menaquinol-cytochrome c reductase iron-sulfur subunit